MTPKSPHFPPARRRAPPPGGTRPASSELLPDCSAVGTPGGCETAIEEKRHQNGCAMVGEVRIARRVARVSKEDDAP